MGLHAVTGYIAHAALLGYWLWVVASTAPQLRRAPGTLRFAHVC